MKLFRLMMYAAVTIACSDSTSPGADIGVPAQPDIVPAQVSAGIEETCGLAMNGDTYCWGGGFTPVPTKVDGMPQFTELRVGVLHFCGLTQTGTVYCRGRNTSGELGDGTTASRSAAAPVAGNLTFASLTTGIFQSCGLTPEGIAYCWGSNTNGQLGDGTTQNRLVPTPVAGNLRFTAIDTYSLVTCGLAVDGPAYCWGWNGGGQIGDGTTQERHVPTRVAGGLSFVRLARGTFPCALTAAGETYCWGEPFGLTPTAVAAPALTSLTGGGGHTCGLTAAGHAYCWGYNSRGQLGDGTRTADNIPGTTAAVPVSGGLTFSQLSAGWMHTCGVSTGGVAYCWGNNAFGHLGDGTTTHRPTPTATARWGAP